MTETRNNEPEDTTTGEASAEQQIDRDDDPAEQLQPGQESAPYPPPSERFTTRSESPRDER